MGRYALCLLLLVGFVVAAPAARGEPAFAVVNMATQLDDGIYYLDADLRLDLNQRARNALGHGVALTFVVPIHIQHSRLWLWHAVVAHLTERYRLHYYPLTERYQIVNLNGGARESYATLGAAMSALEHIRHLPIIDSSLLDRHTRYEVAMRVVLDTKHLPGPLKAAADIVPGWRQSSKWRMERLTP